MKRLILLGTLLWLSNQALPAWYETSFLPPAQNRTLPDVLLDVLGEGRTMLARVLWFKMDLFHEILDDQGVENTRQVQVMPLLRMATYLDPHLEDAYDVMAWDLYRGHGRTGDALSLLEEGLGYNPQSYLLQYRQALILFRSGNLAEAARTAEHLLKVTPGDFDQVQLLRLLYHCYNDLGQDLQALRILEHWVRLRPDDQKAVPTLASLRRKLNR